MRGSLVRARRASISSAGRQWACMSIMACLLSLSSNGLTQESPVCARLFANYRAIYLNRHSDASALPAPMLLGWGLALKYHAVLGAESLTFDIAPGAGAKRGLRLSLLGNCVCLRNSLDRVFANPSFTSFL